VRAATSQSTGRALLAWLACLASTMALTGGGGRPSMGSSSMSSSVGAKKHNKLTNRYEQEVQVAFPLKPLGEAETEEEEEWLSEEDFQTYSVRVRLRCSPMMMMMMIMMLFADGCVIEHSSVCGKWWMERAKTISTIPGREPPLTTRWND